ncbi:MAG TPA: 2-oxoglutarate dehydrogenase E1 component, partial [Nannocystis exedens]|nr:2-oxoglutarate dehydrogenase E1 component [Nannocystis exedens]
EPGSIVRLMLCSGKVYYDLVAHRTELGLEKTVAIIRVEQLYPLALDGLGTLFKRYPKAQDLTWVQEEPRNMGAWTFISPLLRERFGERFGEPRYVGRDMSASPATGHSASHDLERKLLLDDAFDGLVSSPATNPA